MSKLQLGSCVGRDELKSGERKLIIASFISLLVFLPSSKANEPQPGPEFVDRHGCKNCHMIGGQGAVLAPPLDGIKEHRDKEYIIRRLTEIQGKSKKKSGYPVPQELMTHVRISKVEAELVADYLVSLSGVDLEVSGHGKLADDAPPGSHFVPGDASASSARGLKLYKEKGCIACHAVGPAGGKLGPNLAGVGARRSRKFIAARIVGGALLLPKPGKGESKPAMPPSKLSAAQLDDLTNWLETLPEESH